MADRYYWGKPKDVVRWYLRGTLYLSAQSRKSYIEKTGAERGNLPRLLKLLDNLDELCCQYRLNQITHQDYLIVLEVLVSCLDQRQSFQYMTFCFERLGIVFL